MNKITKLAAMFGIVLAIGMSSSCKEDDPPTDPGPDKNVYELVSAKAGYELTVQAIDKAGLKGLLSGSTTLTFFAPSDDALLAAGVDVNAMTAAELKALLEYHISNGNWEQENIPKPGYIKSRLADSTNGRAILIYTDRQATVIEVNGLQTLQTTAATNGHVHFMNDALEPLSIHGHLDINPDLALYNTCVELNSAHLAYIKNGENKTVFASNKAAMEAFQNDQGKSLINIHPDIRRALLYNSTIPDEGVFAADLSATETTLGLDLTITGGGLILDGTINVVKKDIQCTNGVIHIIDDVKIN